MRYSPSQSTLVGDEEEEFNVDDLEEDVYMRGSCEMCGAFFPEADESISRMSRSRT